MQTIANSVEDGNYVTHEHDDQATNEEKTHEKKLKISVQSDYPCTASSSPTKVGEQQIGIRAFDEYRVIIDARTPLEFAEDHLPGAINLPVVEQAEFAEVGTLHRQDPHRAYVVGSAYALKCIAGHIENVVSDYKPTDQILVYCFRGGKRSRLWGDILKAIGFNVDVLSGGWKAYRHWVASNIDTLVAAQRFRVIAGPTGSGKTRLLHALDEQGEQVLDLEALASHRGSVLGALPELQQPSQKRFESLLFDRLRHFRADRVVWVESESKKIGRIHLPRSLHDAICAALPNMVDASIEDRVNLLHEDYGHFLGNLHDMVDRLENVAIETVGRKEVAEWRRMAELGDSAGLFQRMMERHYDPLYERASRRNLRHFAKAERLHMESLTYSNLTAVAQRLIAGEQHHHVATRTIEVDDGRASV